MVIASVSQLVGRADAPRDHVVVGVVVAADRAIDLGGSVKLVPRSPAYGSSQDLFPLATVKGAVLAD